MLIDLLQQQGDFLTLSRQQPQQFSNPLWFELSNGTQVSITAPGIISFEPAQVTDADIVLSSGVHGNETAPIELCDSYVKRLLTGELIAGQRVLFLFGNLPAMDIAQRFVEENMNRLFSGAHSDGPGLVNEERHRAKLLEDTIRQFYLSVPNAEQRYRCHYDLHTAIRGSKNEKFAVYPYLHGKPRKPSQLQFMLACGVSTILLSESSTTTFSYFSSHEFGADAFTVELGQVKPFGQNDMSRFEGVNNTLQRLICGEDLQLKSYDENDFDIYRVNQVINRAKEDFTLNFSDDALNFTDFAKGEVLAQETGKQYVAEYEGEAIVFPNAKVALGQRALLTVIPTSLEQG